MAVAGIYIVVEWRDDRWCSVFLITRDDDDDYWSSGGDYCAEKAWAGVAFVDATLFAGSAYCLFAFAVFRMGKLVAEMNAAAENEGTVEMRDVVMTIPAAPPVDVETAMAIPVPANDAWVSHNTEKSGV